MKQLYYFIAFLALLLILSNASGPGLVQGIDRTGSPLSPGACWSCHGGGSFGVDPSIEIRQNDTVVTSYLPGQTYEVHLHIETSTNPEGYGFQMVALDAATDDGGSLSTSDGDVRVLTLNDRTYLEHTSPLNRGMIVAEWTAPEAGAGEITFYAAGNAVNRDANITGDQAANTSVSLAESTTSAVSDHRFDFQMTIFPNPAMERIHLKLPTDAQLQEVMLYNLQGEVSKYAVDPDLEISDLPPGLYLVEAILNNGHRSWQQFMKM